MNTDIAPVSSAPADSLWETWDRDRFLKIIERLPSSCGIAIFHGPGDCMYSVARSWTHRGVHLAFWDLDGYPHAVCVTRTTNAMGPTGPIGTREIAWLSGGPRVWLDVLEIDRDYLAFAISAVQPPPPVGKLGPLVEHHLDRPIDDTIPARERSDAVRKRDRGRRFSFGALRWPGVAKLNEECGEVGQVIGKLMNFDYDSVIHWDGTNLRDALMDEMGDVQAAIAFVTKHCNLDAEHITERARYKLALFEQWHIEQADEIGTVSSIDAVPIDSTMLRCERCSATMRQVEYAAARVPCPAHGTTAWDDEIERDKARRQLNPNDKEND